MSTKARPQTPLPTGWFRRDTWRAAVICLLLGAIVTVAFSAVYRHLPSNPLRAAANTTYSNDALSTGSIVFEPTFGALCRNLLIDNATWRIRDNGYVDCRTALLGNGSRGFVWSSARVGIIRHGFANR